nr:hypothetical protein Q903MT_gene1464 [Picea sitchensis]
MYLVRCKDQREMRIYFIIRCILRTSTGCTAVIESPKLITQLSLDEEREIREILLDDAIS